MGRAERKDSAEAAARFYAETFPDSAIGAVHRAPRDHPSGKADDALTVEFTVAGVSCLGLNGAPAQSLSVDLTVIHIVR